MERSAEAGFDEVAEVEVLLATVPSKADALEMWGPDEPGGDLKWTGDGAAGARDEYGYLVQVIAVGKNLMHLDGAE